MAFPNIVFGSDGDQYVTGTTQTADVSTKLVLADGRAFRYALAGAVALVAGDVIQAPVPVTNHVLQTLSVAAVAGDKSVAVVLGATAATADQYKDGYLAIELGTGFGYTYQIATHAAVASAGTFTVPLRATVQVAIPTTANTVSLISNAYRSVIQAPITTLTGAVVGVAVKPAAISAYSWLQTHGPGTVTTIGTVVIGANAVSPTGTAAGACGPSGASTSTNIGRVMHVATTTNKSLIDLAID